MSLAAPGFEVAGFVEDVVGGEEAFDAGGDGFAIAEDGDGVVEWAAGGGGVFDGGADEGGDVGAGVGDFVKGVGRKG